MKLQQAIKLELSTMKKLVPGKERDLFLVREKNMESDSMHWARLYVSAKGAVMMDNKPLSVEDINADDYCLIRRIEYRESYINREGYQFPFPFYVKVNEYELETVPVYHSGPNNAIKTPVGLIHKQDFQDLAGDVIEYRAISVRYRIIRK